MQNMQYLKIKSELKKFATYFSNKDKILPVEIPSLQLTIAIGLALVFSS